MLAVQPVATGAWVHGLFVSHARRASGGQRGLDVAAIRRKATELGFFADIGNLWYDNETDGNLLYRQDGKEPTAKEIAGALVVSFDGKEQERAYFAGCSTGGRMAAMEARRLRSRGL